MTEDQRRLLNEIVRRLLREGYVLSVYAIQAWVTFRSSDQDEIMASLGNAISETIHVHETIGVYVGCIELDYSKPNVPDFITDYTGPFGYIIAESDRLTSTTPTETTSRPASSAKSCASCLRTSWPTNNPLSQCGAEPSTSSNTAGTSTQS